MLSLEIQGMHECTLGAAGRELASLIPLEIQGMQG